MPKKRSIDLTHDGQTTRIKFNEDGKTVFSSEISNADLISLKGDIDDILCDIRIAGYFENSEKYVKEALENTELMQEIRENYKAEMYARTHSGWCDDLANTLLDNIVDEYSLDLARYDRDDYVSLYLEESCEYADALLDDEKLMNDMTRYCKTNRTASISEIINAFKDRLKEYKL